MAIKKDIETSFGINVQSAYHRVMRVQLIDKSKIEFVVGVFKDQDTQQYITAKPFSCVYDIAGNNPIAQAYAHLKTLPEFAGATDC